MTTCWEKKKKYTTNIKEADYLVIQDNCREDEARFFAPDKRLYFSREAMDSESIKKYPNDLKKKIIFELSNLRKNSLAKNFSEYVEQQVGKTLTKMFFKGYPKKIWGISTDKMTAEWAPKRIQITQKTKPFFQDQYTAVSKYGTGNFYNSILKKILKLGGNVYLNHKVSGFSFNNNMINGIIFDKKKKVKINQDDILISTLPITIASKLLGYESKLKFRGVRSIYVSINKNRVMPKNIPALSSSL